METQFKLHWTVSQSDGGKLLKEFLIDKNISKSALTDIKFKGGALFINGENVTVRHILKENDHVVVYFPIEKPSVGMKAEHFPLDILFEDDYFLVINKPAGMNTIPSREHPTGSLANGLIGYYQQSKITATTHIVTRLDRDTSGVVLIAKHRHVHHLMSLEQRADAIKRIYVALAEGNVAEKKGIIEQPIARKSSSIIEREVDPKGQYACTEYRVIQQFEGFAYMKLRLKTGRTHQIRVHLSYLGHPLLGDDLYGGKTGQITRQALHCQKIQFKHPILNQEMSFTAPLPKDIESILAIGKSI